MKKLTIAILFLLSNHAYSQEADRPTIVKSAILFKAQSASDELQKMVELTETIPNLKLQLLYAGKENFTGKRMYPSNTNISFLRNEPAKALQAVADDAKQLGLGLLIWDAYRPYTVTVRFWKLIHDERYVANPAKGSGHNRGIAVDLSLYTLSDGQLLNMPTHFDDFSEKAHHGYMQLEKEQIRNRELLLSLMEKHGFKRFDTEWWHYYWPNGQLYPVLDIPFKKLKKTP